MVNRIIGVLVVAMSLAVVVKEWTGNQTASHLSALGAALFLILATPLVPRSRQAFVAVGLALLAAAALVRDDAASVTVAAFSQAAFIGAFFTALASLRNPASTSPAIARCGQFLATQPPGRRYLALTAGGHVFALLLSYGAITLLGGMTEAVARREPDPVIREIRNRRMLLAIQRGFVASLCWSPLAFAMAITTSIIPGASWSGSVLFGLLNAALVTFVGWLLDRLIKSRLTPAARAAAKPIGRWRDTAPLLFLLVILFGGVILVEIPTQLRVIAVVMALVPLVAIGWMALQARGETGPEARLPRRLARYAVEDVPSYKSELVLLMMAGFIGSAGAALLDPLLGGHTGVLLDLPVPLVLAALVVTVPVLGQLGMNPILSVSLLASLLPPAEALGISPNALVVAITAGWALAGASSPFTATTLLVGRLGNVSALEVGLVWNRTFMIVATLTLIASSLLAAEIL